ncbi:unnamed protein product [Alopecurus aequalis]
MEGVNGSPAEEGRKPLSEMVDDCVQRWFQDTLKEARRGDTAMQVLVAQMYNSGYGIPRNEHKALGSASWPLGPIPCRFHDFTLRRDRRSREDNGWRRHQDTGLPSGGLAQNVQDIMLATLILMKEMMISSNNN